MGTVCVGEAWRLTPASNIGSS